MSIQTTTTNGDAQKSSKSERPLLPSDIGTDYNFKREIVWFNVVAFILLHLAAFYGMYCGFFCKWQTHVFGVAYGWCGGIGVTAGAHRYFTHRSYSAKWPLRLFLLFGQTTAGQNCMYVWARDHRQHHKFSDTDADPHNANRGFFFSHIGWLMSRKHPLVIEKGKTIDMSDLEADSMVMFQKRHYLKLYWTFAIFLPALVPVFFWNENWVNAMLYCSIFRYIHLLNTTWAVNSVAHFYGMKPYDKNVRAVESPFVSRITQGEGWHNYHHAFPWDYRAAEFGLQHSYTTGFIDTMVDLGLAYNCKSALWNSVKNTAMKKGDGSHPVFGLTANGVKTN